MAELAAFNREVVGSNPTGCTKTYLRSSMVELAALNREVVGSSPTGGTKTTTIQHRIKKLTRNFPGYVFVQYGDGGC